MDKRGRGKRINTWRRAIGFKRKKRLFNFEIEGWGAERCPGEGIVFDGREP